MFDNYGTLAWMRLRAIYMDKGDLDNQPPLIYFCFFTFFLSIHALCSWGDGSTNLSVPPLYVSFSLDLQSAKTDAKETPIRD